MLVMFACILVGFVLKKKRLLPDGADGVMSRLETCVFLPALNIHTFMQYATLTSLKEQAGLLAVSAGVVLAAIGLAYALAGRLEKEVYRKNLYRYALTFGNFGFMGNAIVPLILGEEMLYPYLLFTLPLTVAIYTWGMVMLIPPAAGKKHSFGQYLLNPGTVSVVVGLLLGVLGVGRYMPAFVTTTLGNLSACMGPVAMVLTGFVIGSYELKTLLKKPAVYVASVLRLLVLPALFLGILLLLRVGREAVVMCLFAFATPLGLNTVVFPAAYGGDTSTGASMAMISHTLCVVSIPLMYALLSVLM